MWAAYNGDLIERRGLRTYECYAGGLVYGAILRVEVSAQGLREVGQPGQQKQGDVCGTDWPRARFAQAEASATVPRQRTDYDEPEIHPVVNSVARKEGTP